MSAQVTYVCAACGTTKGVSFVCGRCESETYCSAECQRLAWKVHKKVCRKIASASQTGAEAAASSVAKDLSDSIEALFEKESPRTCSNTESVQRPCGATAAGDTGAGDVAAGTPKADVSLKLGDASVASSSSAPVRDVPADVAGGVPVHPRALGGQQTTVCSGAGEQCKEGTATDNHPQDDREDEEREEEEDEEAVRERLLREKADEERRHKLLKLGKQIQHKKKKSVKKEENESRKAHAQQVREEEELRRKAEAEESRRAEEQRRRERQEHQRQLQEEQAAMRKMEEERRKEIAERKRQRDEEKALKMKQEMERELAMQRKEKAKAEAERKKREDAQRLDQERRRAEEEQRKKIEVERREQAHQRMVEEKEADERRRQRLLERKRGMSWRENVARAREEEMQAPDLKPELREKLERRKAQSAVEYAARKRMGLEEESSVPEKSVNDGYEDQKQRLREHGRKKREALVQTARERLQGNCGRYMSSWCDIPQGTHFEGESDEDTDEMEYFMMSHRRQKELIAKGQLKNSGKPRSMQQAELKEAPPQKKGAATEKAIEQAGNDAEKLWQSERLRQLLHKKRQKDIAKAEETDKEEDEEERQEVKNSYIERLRQKRKSPVAQVQEEDVKELPGPKEMQFIDDLLEQEHERNGNADGDAQRGTSDNLHREHAENGNEELMGNAEQDEERGVHEEVEEDADKHGEDEDDERNQDEGEESEEEEHDMAEDTDVAMPSHQTASSSSSSRAVPRPVVPDDSDSDDDEQEDNTTFDSLMRNLKMQIGRPAQAKQQKKVVEEAACGEQRRPPATAPPADEDALDNDRERSEAAQRTMELLEARRMAELSVESKSRRKKGKSWVNKYCGREFTRRKMDEELLAEEERAARNANNKGMIQKK